MKLQEIFDHLTYGELADTHIAGKEEGGISKENRKNIIKHVSMGLTELHKRFFLKEGRIKLDTQAGLHTYVLKSQFARSVPPQEGVTQYILDSMEAPFQDDILQVERIYGADHQAFNINDTNDRQAIRTPTYNILVMPEDFEPQVIEVVYRANHPELGDHIQLLPPNTVNIDLPVTHLEALLLYIASRVMNPVGMSGEFHEGNNYSAKFEEACFRLQSMNYQIDQSSTNTRLEKGGWV